ncbi:hypothetical protein [Bacillus sp. EB600]|uniref:hypothetical protein n=1 Tax=Bacillus sp. EB600 TaxID=2806345 RepID=UPI002108854A|nr:hypothetical protein [Bacillus sp. EB600]MCQ6279664.1 hypothetical protein [Bacillus sp. EB600]
MNINKLARGYLSTNLSGEEFLEYVASAIEQQLKEWDKSYEVFVMQLTNYEVMIKNGDQYYHVQLTVNELDSLQKSSPFQLDRKVWSELEKQELPIIRGTGNYIETVL